MNHVTFASGSVTRALRSFWNDGQRTERIAYVTGVLLIASGLTHAAILVFTGASWAGPLSLRKPATFGLSFGLTLATITWVASFLDLAARVRALLLGAFSAASVLETALVSLQAWRGVPSHFNVETSFDAWVARSLAAGGVVLVVVILALTVAAFRRSTTLPISLRVAVQVGFAALVGAVLVGAFMIARGMTLVFSGDPQAAYTTGGALKPTHAVLMHAILVLPALAWLLSFVNWTEQRRLGVVLAAAAGYAIVAGAIAVGNLLRLDLWQMPSLASTVIAVGSLSLLAIALVVLRALVAVAAPR